MPNENLAVFQLVTGMITHRKDVSKIRFWPQKPEFPLDAAEAQPFERTDPEAEGISSAYILDFLHTLRHTKEAVPHQLMILRRDKVIFECAFFPWKEGVWHSEYSLSKSLVGMAVGLLVEEGKMSLDMKISDVFPPGTIGFLNPAYNLTVRQLLTMSTTSSYNESGAIVNNTWTKNFLSSSLEGTPGKDFQYNSMNTYMLSSMLTKITGETVTEYLKPRVFEPLGIRDYFWEQSPERVTKGGWGLFMKPEDMAKLGTLYRHEGAWKGRQVVPAEWVKESTHKQIDTPQGYGYGYQMWMEDRPDSFAFTGMLGQNVLVYPDTEMVIVTNGGNRDMVENEVMMGILRRYWGASFDPSKMDLSDPQANKRLLKYKEKIENLPKRKEGPSSPEEKKGLFLFGKKEEEKKEKKDPAEEAMELLHGKSYLLEEQTMGLFPLVIQAFHNNYSDGIRMLRFRKEESGFFLDVLEGTVVFSLPVGFDDAPVYSLVEHGESYLVRALGEFARDEDGRLCLKVRIAYIEEACERLMKIFFEPDMNSIEIRMDETPGSRMIMEGLQTVRLEGGVEKMLMNFLKGSGAVDAYYRLIHDEIRPSTTGRKKRWLDLGQ